MEEREVKKQRIITEVLTVGDGNLSFSLALAKANKDFRVTATTYEDRNGLRKKYGDRKIAETISELEKDGHRVVHGVDAMKIDEKFQGENFKKVIFMHPLVPSEDRKSIIANFRRSPQNLAVLANRRLLVKFLRAALPLIKALEGTVEISIKNVFPYTTWRVHRLARHVPGLAFIRKEISDSPPGYESRDLERDTTFALTKPENFVFAISDRPTAADGLTSNESESFLCEDCEVRCTSQGDLEKHRKSQSHRKRLDLEAAWTEFVTQGGLD